MPYHQRWRYLISPHCFHGYTNIIIITTRIIIILWRIECVVLYDILSTTVSVAVVDRLQPQGGLSYTGWFFFIWIPKLLNISYNFFSHYVSVVVYWTWTLHVPIVYWSIRLFTIFQNVTFIPDRHQTTYNIGYFKNRYTMYKILFL